MNIKIEHLRKQFGTFTAVDDVTLDIREGELFGGSLVFHLHL